MEQPQPFGDHEKDEVCLLKKSLYGLRQSGREWNFALDKLLKSEGMARSKADPCVYISKKKLIVGVYVDDLLIIAEDEKQIANFKSRLGEKFDANDLGISWSSKKQQSTALSTVEAEYIAMCHAAKEALWLQNFMKELHAQEFMHEPQVLLVDNQGAIALAKNQVTSDRRKHIDLKYHFLRDKVEEERLQLRYVESSSNSADLFTKPLNGKMTWTSRM
ncbi:hypothetical protein MTO96_033252 [Rhipicephalus appendiculatus]